MEKLYINTLNDSKYIALITVLDYEISVSIYLKQLSFEASSNKPEHVLVDLALKAVIDKYRFVEFDINESGKIELDSYKYVSLNTFYEILANTLLKEKKELLLNSILTDSQINQLLNFD
ncbi:MULTISPECIES: type II toxin-antitoxin system RnlB family antitoxin [Catenibacterium]|uniref:Type II toxin-antitoxin system RnlB family antitoxin n=1 Tax=Catenibacterium faecis TaxID=2764323 RepID=A0ABR7K9P8_9FIRM|nr:type II toxin-antitoxin system RnlB family antitoxin [Catenibacterium faecis]MBC6009324.1 type II toxin-antitoxin system RnlB family antitoxin [Catenibacterium faecis]